MPDASKFFLTEQKQSQETRFEKKREHPFHRQCLANDAARGFRKRSPVRAELKFHRDAGDNAQRKIHPEDPRPETCRTIVMFIAGSQRFGLQVDEQQRQSHRQLRKDVVKCNRESEVQPVYVQCLSHRVTSRRFLAMFSLCGRCFPAACEQCGWSSRILALLKRSTAMF